ncbi:hypothetical protein C8R48DRAFT_768707 [Suillus tomentosus]|nr:hypothetical protein C8R48DRAFT_768707 [Suillus tomentosus]
MSVNESVVSPHENNSRSALHLEVERPISSIETPVNVGGTTQDMNAGLVTPFAGLVTPFILVLLGDNPIQNSCGFHQCRNCRFAVEQYPDIPCIAGADPNSSDSENMRKSLAGNEEQSTKQYGDRHEIWDRNLATPIKIQGFLVSGIETRSTKKPQRMIRKTRNMYVLAMTNPDANNLMVAESSRSGSKGKQLEEVHPKKRPSSTNDSNVLSMALSSGPRRAVSRIFSNIYARQFFSISPLVPSGSSSHSDTILQDTQLASRYFNALAGS